MGSHLVTGRRRDLIVLALVALLLRTAAALVVSRPPYTDPAYYTLVAQQLATGHGFQVPVLWSFLEVGGRLPASPTLPVASNGHWMPLTSIVAAGSMVLFGSSWLAGEVPMIALSVALVVLTYEIGRELWSSRRIALSASFLSLFAGPMLVYMPMVDAFAVFGICGASAIYASVRAVRSASPGQWLLLSGVAVGLATLARVDGLLLAVAPATAWVLAGHWPSVSSRFAWGLASGCGALLVMGPWLLRNASVFGALFPSAGGHTLWITTYNEQFSIASDPTLASYLAWGVPAIVGSKVAAAVELMGRTAVLMGGVFVIFFAVGLLRERGRRELLPFIVYFWVMFAAMALVFTFHAPMGAFYHSAWAWLPFAFPLAVASLEPTANRLGRYWRFLRSRRPQSVLLVAGLVGAMVLSVVGSASLVATWRQQEIGMRGAAEYLRAHANRDDRVLAYDPARLYLLTGNPGVAPPFDPFKTVARVVSAYSVKWIVVTLNPGERRDPLGLWDGVDATDAVGDHPTFLLGEPVFKSASARVYAVTNP